jgi:hypothetical protein
MLFTVPAASATNNSNAIIDGTSNTVMFALTGEMLSNASKTRSEISMTFARNARA